MLTSLVVANVSDIGRCRSGGHSGVKDKQGVSVFTPAGKYQDSQLDAFPETQE